MSLLLLTNLTGVNAGHAKFIMQLSALKTSMLSRCLSLPAEGVYVWVFPFYHDSLTLSWRSRSCHAYAVHRIWKATCERKAESGKDILWFCCMHFAQNWTFLAVGSLLSSCFMPRKVLLQQSCNLPLVLPVRLVKHSETKIHIPDWLLIRPSGHMHIMSKY